MTTVITHILLNLINLFLQFLILFFKIKLFFLIIYYGTWTLFCMCFIFSYFPVLGSHFILHRISGLPLSLLYSYNDNSSTMNYYHRGKQEKEPHSLSKYMIPYTYSLISFQFHFCSIFLMAYVTCYNSLKENSHKNNASPKRNTVK